MDILVGRFRGRLLWGVEAFAALATLIIAILLARFAWSFFNDAFTIGDSTTDAEIDTWPSKLLVPIAFAMLSFRMLVQFLGALRLFLSPGLVPVGVVVQKDIAEQAQDEIREAMAGGDKA
jgi:TRAP-type mannitol/chloroaromatic compound transport system permease small subunit